MEPAKPLANNPSLGFGPRLEGRNLRPLTLKCKCCGVERPSNDFRTDKRSRTGYALVCKACEKQRKKNMMAQHGETITADIKQRDLESFTAVELMLELRRRGYDGELTVTERRTVRLRDL